MDFPWTRHLQRYEYILAKGYTDHKIVADLGCGLPYGAYALSANANLVFGVDLDMERYRNCSFSTYNQMHQERVNLVVSDLYDFDVGVDVCIAIEVFEHMASPRKFIKHLARLGEYAFLTTPLAEVTGKTRNMEHVAEYSAKDFDATVSTKFTILKKVYQKSNLSIVGDAKPSGDSINFGHVVQMIWCKRK